MRVLVATVTHHPDDARILHRQIAALVDAGHEVTYAAPFVADGAEPPRSVAALDLPRAGGGRARLEAARAAGRLLRRHADAADVVLLCDMELLVAARSLRHPCVVWDVRADAFPVESGVSWLLRPGAAFSARLGERWAERNVRVLLAEAGFQHRFRDAHPVVPDVALVPMTVEAPTQARAVHLGALSSADGLADLIELGERLAGIVEVELIGPAAGDARDAVLDAQAAGYVRWFGDLSSDAALDRLRGATAGLALAHETREHRPFLPARIIEYLAYGVPVVTTPLAGPASVVERERCGIVVPFQDPAAAARAVLRLFDDEKLAAAYGARGHEAALLSYDWRLAGPDFVRTLERMAGATRTGQGEPVAIRLALADSALDRAVPIDLSR